MVFLENGADPQNTENTGTGNGSYRRTNRVACRPERAGGNLVQAANRLVKKDAQNSHTGALDHGRIRGK